MPLIQDLNVCVRIRHTKGQKIDYKNRIADAIALELTEKDFVDFLRLEFINLGYDEDIVKRLQEQNWTAALAYMLEEGKNNCNDALVI